MQGKMEKTLSVHIYDITTTDIGLWQVNVSNEFGSAVISILIRSSHSKYSFKKKKRENKIMSMHVLSRCLTSKCGDTFNL